MSKEISYNGGILEIVDSLTKINPSVIFWKEEDHIRVSMLDIDRLIGYKMTFPLTMLDIDDTIAFYNYPEFHQLYKMIPEASIIIDDHKKIRICGETTKIGYFLSPVEKVNIASDDKPLSPKNFKFEGSSFSFSLTKKMLAELKSTSSKLGVQIINLKSLVADKTVIMKMYNVDEEISFEKMLPLDVAEGCTESFDFDIIADHITRLPSIFDYVVNVNANGQIRFSAVTSDENVKLDIHTSKRKA